MVRLRSDRWYSADGQRRSRRLVGNQTSNSRRLISLCFLLGLVILLMQRASDPAHVRNFFAALGVPLEEENPVEHVDFGDSVQVVNRAQGLAQRSEGATDSAAQPDSSDARESSNLVEVSRWEQTCRDLVERLLGGADATEHRELARHWFGLPQGGLGVDLGARASAKRSLADGRELSDAVSTGARLDSEPTARLLDLKAASLGELQKLIAEFAPAEDTTSEEAAESGGEIGQESPLQEVAQDDWGALLRRFDTQWHLLWELVDVRVEGSGREVPHFLPEFQQTLDDFLDQALLSGLRDASPWTSKESVSFWRLLSKSQGLSAVVGSLRGVDLISTQQLESEIKYYRGKSVRFRGSLRRLERVERGQPELGIQSYWLAWLRGLDGAVQPVAVYGGNDLFDDWAGIDLEGPDYPEVEVIALPAKKIAYASQSGVEVAPTLFAIAVGKLSRRTEPQVATATTEEVWQDFTYAALLGLLLAGFVLVPVFLKWNASPVVRPRGIFKPQDNFKQQGSDRGAASKGNKATSWLLLAIVLPGSTLAQDSPGRNSDERSLASPPWARDVDPKTQRMELLRDRLSGLFSDQAINLTEQYFSGGQEAMPDDNLKVLRVLQQLQWPQFGSELRIELAGSNAFLMPFSTEGFVVDAAPVALTGDQRNWFQLSKDTQVYRLVIEPSVEPFQGESIHVLCSSVPRMWVNSPELRQFVLLDGIAAVRSTLAESTDVTGDDAIVSMFVKRPRWLLPPEKSNSATLSPALPDHWLPLARIGWDLARVDTVVSNQQLALQVEESEGLFELLRFADLSDQPSGDFIAPLEAMGKPGGAFGRRLRWQVRLVNGSVVPLESPEDQSALGQDYYIQFDGFVQIGNQRVRYRVGDEDVQFEREFPVTILTRSTESFVPMDDLHSGVQAWEVGQYAEVEGLFYRLWSYRSELMKQKSDKARQIAPLVIASNLKASVPPVPRASAGEIGWFGYALCAATLVILVCVLLIASRNMRRSRLA